VTAMRDRVSTAAPRMWRRAAQPVDPQQFMEQVLFLPLQWPHRTTSLQYPSLLDFRQRTVSTRISVAELYHENSKLFPAKTSDLAAATVDASAVRHEFVRRRSAVLAAHGPKDSHPASDRDQTRQWRGSLTAVARATDLELFYAVEVRLVAGGKVFLHEPLRDRLIIVKRLRSSEEERLRQGLRLPPFAKRAEPGDAWVILVASFARNDVLYGARGYRRTLLEGGTVGHEVVRQARLLGHDAEPIYEFADRQVDDVMEADGVEEGTIMAVELREARDGN
jgi:hypothetical protein